MNLNRVLSVSVSGEVNHMSALLVQHHAQHPIQAGEIVVLPLLVT